MADESGKARAETVVQVDRPTVNESEVSRPGLEKYFPPGPWTDAHEEWFEIMIKEFGGAPERDSDL